MKKNIFIALFVFTLFQAYSQILDNTGSSNPFNNLSQQEKNTKLLDICNIKYKTSDAKKVKVIIKLLLEAGADPDYILEHNQMPVLYQAIIRKNHDAVRALIDGGADLSFVNEDGESFIYFMIKNDFPIREIEYALQKGAPAYGKKTPYREPVIKAISKKNLDMVKLLEKYGASLKTTNDSYEKYPLLYAANIGDADIVRYCIEKGCKPSEIGKNYPPPVYYALCHEDFELAEYLIKNGDNINKPFSLSDDSCQTYILQAMLQLNKLQGVPYIKYQHGTIKRVLELGADPYLKDAKGNNAFQSACSMLKGRVIGIGILMELFEYGYTICPNPDYKKSLEEAICCDNTEEVKQILKHYKTDKNSKFLLMLGFISNLKHSEENMQLLLDAGITPDYETIYTSLFYTPGEYSNKLCSYINFINGNKDWNHDFISYCFIKHPVTMYYESNYLEHIVNLVLDNGISFDTMIYNENKDFPEKIPFLFYIVINDKSNNCSGIQALLDRGADINQTWNGKHPIDYLDIENKNYRFLRLNGAEIHN